MNKKCFDLLDISRILALMMVFFLHCSIGAGRDFPSNAFLSEHNFLFLFHTPAWGGGMDFFHFEWFFVGSRISKPKIHIIFKRNNTILL